MDRVINVVGVGSDAVHITVASGPWGWLGRLLGLHHETVFLGRQRRWFNPEGWLVDDEVMIDRLEQAYIWWKVQQVSPTSTYEQLSTRY